MEKLSLLMEIREVIHECVICVVILQKNVNNNVKQTVLLNNCKIKDQCFILAYNYEQKSKGSIFRRSVEFWNL